MFYVFLLLPLVLVLVTSYYFNKKIFNVREKDLLVLTTIHGLLSYLLIVIFINYASIGIWIYLLVILILFALLIFGVYSIKNKLFYSVQQQVFVIVNNLIVYAITLLPLSVLLTIFRYLDGSIQIVLSVIITIVLILVSFILKKKVLPDGGKIVSKYSTWGQTIKIGIPVLIIIVFFIFFNVPTKKAALALNLYNGDRYLAFDEFPNDIQNDYTPETKIELEVEGIAKKSVNDFFYNDDYFYYMNDEAQQLKIYDRNSKVWLSDVTFAPASTSSTCSGTKSFFELNNTLYLLASDGFYSLTGVDTTKLSDVSYCEGVTYIKDDTIEFMVKTDINTYEMIVFEDNTFSSPVVYDLTSLSHDNIMDIGDNIFDYDSFTEKYSLAFERLNDTYNIDGLTYSGFVGPVYKSKIRVDSETEDYIGYYRPIEKEAFFFINDYKAYISASRVKDGEVVLMQVDSNLSHDVITIYSLNYRDAEIDFPFYSYYGVWTLPWIIGAFFMPVIIKLHEPAKVDFEGAVKGKYDKE